MTPRSLCLFFLLAACSDASEGAPDGGADSATPGHALLAYFNLPREPSTEALSATFFDATTSTLYALQDTEARIVPITTTAGYATWTVGTPIALTGRPAPDWDGEGLARGSDGAWYVVTDEIAPTIERFSAAGAYLGPVTTPARFAAQSSGNKGIESLSMSPSGAYLFFANEGALLADGPLASKRSGTRVRILRRDLATGTDEEHAYVTEPTGEGSGGDAGVSDVTAIGDHEVLVLERGFQAGFGNTVRIYRTDLTSGPDVSALDALDATTQTVTKTLVLDLATLPADGVPVADTQPNPLLDNYEALALGPILPDGRRVVFVTSDDNQHVTQVARILVLALAL